MGKPRIGTMVTAVLLAGCASERPSPPPRPTTVLPSMSAALTPALYMEVASNSALFAVRASELAQTRSTSSALRSAATKVARDQGGVGSQLSFAGRRIDLLPRSTLPPAMEADLDRLRASGSFDSDYRRIVGDALAKALQAHEVFARGGSSPTLKPVASMAAPITRADLDAVRR